MSRPTDAQISALFRRLREAGWKDLERRLLAAYHHNTGPRAQADGYPASVGGGGNGGGELTSVEAAAEQRLLGAGRDHQLECVAYAISDVDLMVRALDRLHNRLSKVGVPEPFVPKICEACVTAGLKPPPAHCGSLGGRLNRVYWLCESCYTFAARTGRIPTPEELSHHERTGRWKVRVSA